MSSKSILSHSARPVDRRRLDLDISHAQCDIEILLDYQSLRMSSYLYPFHM